jgi:hypothetical protein
MTQSVIRVNAEPLDYRRPLRLVNDKEASRIVKAGGTVAVFARYEPEGSEEDERGYLRDGLALDSGLQVLVKVEFPEKGNDLVIARVSTAQDSGLPNARTRAECEADAELVVACVRRALPIFWAALEDPDEYWADVEQGRYHKRPRHGWRRRGRPAQ